jgi:carbon-monoxide dehydrogenase large subunit
MMMNEGGVLDRVSSHRYGIGQPVLRVEDPRLLAGQGRFVEDICLPGEVHGVVLQSPHPHARILSIDATRARALPGVLLVLTGEDARDDGLGGFAPLFLPRGAPSAHATSRPILAVDEVRCVGDRVAFVVAETLEAARDAVEMIDIDWEPLPAVVDVVQAIAPDAPQVWADCPGNVAARISLGDEAATNQAFARASHVVSLCVRNNRIAPNPIEPRAAIGRYEASSGRYTLYTTSQNPHGVRSAIAQGVLHVPETDLRVIAPDVGGGFGLKSNPHPEDALVLWAARRCGRPVRWVATRSESLAGDHHARDESVTGELALAADGRILALRCDAVHALGAWFFSAAAATLEFSVMLIPSIYDIAVVHLVEKGVYTHTAPIASYRGAGRPEAIYLIERLLDEAASVLGLSVVEIRRRNLVSAQRMPWRTATGFTYDSGDFAALIDRALVESDWDGYAIRVGASQAAGLLRGRSLVCYIEQGGRFNERMGLRFDPSGAVTIIAGTHSHGQGHATTYAQMVSEWLGIPFESIGFIQGDTDEVPFGRGTFAARASLVGGGALKLAAERIVERARPMAAHLLEVPAEDLTFAVGRFVVQGTDRSLSLIEVARRLHAPVGVPAGMGIGLEADGVYSADPPNYPNGCHVCECEIDPETGEVALDRYVVVDDLGRVVNPLICEGQIQGGLAQGIGQALIEQVVYDAQSGQLLTGSFMDYAMPRASDMPPVRLAFQNVPSTTNPLGIKGAGEAGAIGSPPAVINAILAALRPVGVEHIEMPATAMQVWRALRNARERMASG